MKNTETITENKIFTRLYGKGRTAVSGSAVVYYRQNNLHKNRLGLTSTKKNRVRCKKKSCKESHQGGLQASGGQT